MAKRSFENSSLESIIHLEKNKEFYLITLFIGVLSTLENANFKFTPF